MTLTDVTPTPPTDPATRLTSRRVVAVLGATGFVGRRAVTALTTAGIEVLAVTRRPDVTVALTKLGARPVVLQPGLEQDLAEQLSSTDLLVDLTQPALPARLTVTAMRRVADERLTLTRRIMRILGSLPSQERPLLLVTSGADDLQPDQFGRIGGDSPLRARPRGFAHVGIPVRRAVEDSDVAAAFLYLRNLGYGPGKAFRDILLPAVRDGSARVIGDGTNRLPLTHVDDAATAVAHLAALSDDQVAGRGFLAVPAQPVTQAQLYQAVAEALRVPRPGRVPDWVARVAVGTVQTQLMTLDAVADPSSLTSTGYSFTHPDGRAAVHQAAAEASRPCPVPTPR